MSKFAPHSRSHNNPRATSSTVCQKCLKTGQFPSFTVLVDSHTDCAGHFIYECKSTRPYVSRPSRTQQLEKPGVLAKLREDGKSSVEVPDEFKSKCVLPYYTIFVVGNLTSPAFRTGTANRILEAKEKEREKEKDKGKGKEKSRKKPRRCAITSSICT